ncbi:NAD-dependent epimerase/dehydratase family protein [Chondromyces apiculatus]|uniref:Nucleoside-diphosphate-sugar epimerase n=1 Tax=Chondromyces apiculatus DSM 436 TaxID=1192034 RepID=A0A017THQ7_9BACT|nr:NAD(P)H-binding protein [Chondromyces apiculatus]EYF08375.1 Nucleoside-diphosphate-sugar epimerase [Chondromyces apiculatus DSM 436]
MRIAVIGGTGFTGLHTVNELVRRGHQVVAAARKPAFDAVPEGVERRVLDVDRASDAEISDLLAGCNGVVFAAGLDDRSVRKAPAYASFHAANVLPVVRLIAMGKAAGVTRVVVHASYFTHFNRVWPEMRLAERHAYIRSRVEQARAAKVAAGDAVRVTLLELPFIFGSVPGRVPLWAPLVKYVESSLPLLAPRGGTAACTVEQVAEASANALESDDPDVAGLHPVVEDNLTWTDLLARLSAVAGHPRPVHALPGALMHVGLFPIVVSHKLTGREAGMDTAHMPEFFLRELFIDPTASQALLGYRGHDLETSFSETVAACHRP